MHCLGAGRLGVAEWGGAACKLDHLGHTKCLAEPNQWLMWTSAASVGVLWRKEMGLSPLANHTPWAQSLEEGYEKVCLCFVPAVSVCFV